MHDVRRVDDSVHPQPWDHVWGSTTCAGSALQKAAIPCYGDERTLADLRRIYAYIFNPDTPKGAGVPQVALACAIGEFCIGPAVFVPVPILHGSRTILGYRVGSFAYLTDCSEIPESSWPLLHGVTTLIIDALRERPHPTHLSVAQALTVVDRAGARESLLHAHVPRLAACGHVRASAGRRGVGI
jgi:phosphoribosyl 1,2-cyclic phosphate phosphodiesterase